MAKQTVTEKWLGVQSQFLTDEAFVEVSIGVTETGAQEDASASATDNLFFADVQSVTDIETDKTTREKSATLEHNFWILGGDQTVLEDGETITNSGYIGSGELTISFSSVHNFLLPGIVITWSKSFDEYAISFTVTAYNGETVVAQAEVSDNNTVETVVDIDLSGYDRIVIAVNKWSIPGHYARIESVYIGHILVFTKSDLMSFKHKSHGDLLSGELPKNEITFTINNIDGRWNPSNASGATRYLSEQQMAQVRYGFKVDGSVEWIKGGRFHLYEWTASANGIDATFSARDVFDFMIDKTYIPTAETETLYDIITDAFAQAEIEDTVLYLGDVLNEYSASFADEDLNIAEVIQYCANAAGCVMYQDRDGNLHVEPLTIEVDYSIKEDFEWSHPEITLSKPLRNVVVKYGDNQTYTQNHGNSGEDQTLNNKYIASAEQAQAVAEYTAEILGYRETAEVDFRADPRLDVFDAVMMDGKYGTIGGIVTDVTYSFSGAFHGHVKCRHTSLDDLSLYSFDGYALYSSDDYALSADGF